MLLIKKIERVLYMLTGVGKRWGLESVFGPHERSLLASVEPFDRVREESQNINAIAGLRCINTDCTPCTGIRPWMRRQTCAPTRPSMRRTSAATPGPKPSTMRRSDLCNTPLRGTKKRASPRGGPLHRA